MSNDDGREFHPHSLGGIVNGMLHEINADAAGIDPLKGHPGLGLDILRDGRNRLNVNAAAGQSLFEREEQIWAEVEKQYAKGEKLCESPIERAMLAALLTADWSFSAVECPSVHSPADRDEGLPESTAIIIPQMAIVRYRLDFGLVVKFGKVTRIIGVECDGAEFHDRERDEKRDRYLHGLGVPVVRLTGQRIHKEPLRAADEIVNGIAVWIAL